MILVISRRPKGAIKPLPSPLLAILVHLGGFYHPSRWFYYHF